MSRFALPQNERLLELLTDKALQGLSEQEQAELDVLLAASGVSEDETLMMAAAAAELAMLESSEMRDMPAGLRRRLELSADQFAASVNPAPGAPTLRLADDGSRSVPRRAVWLPWLATAAAVVLAALAWWPKASTPATTPLTLVQARAELAASPGILVVPWGDWDNPEVPGVKGDVTWDEAGQRGYMRFAGLPAKDPAVETYQLWIIDSRGMEQRVSGGVFSGSEGSATGEIIVPIEPGLAIQGAGAFAVTIEPPGGNAVSDMKRRVVIAAKQ